MAIRSTFTTGEVLTAADLTDTIKGAFINTETTTARTLGTADAGNLVTLNNNSGGTVTIPTNTTWGSPLGTLVHLINIGTAGSFTVGTAAGVTLNAASATLAIQEGGTLIKTATNTWQFVKGDGLGKGLVFITASTFSASTAVNVNNCFTSTYDNYRIVVAVDSVSTTNGVNLRLRASGTDNSSSNYYYNGPHIVSSSSVSVDVYRSSGLATSFVVIHSDNNGSGNCSLDLFNPARSVRTMIASTFINQNSTDMRMASPAGLMSVTTSYDGFSLIPTTGNITGNVRVYGYRNS